MTLQFAKKLQDLQIVHLNLKLRDSREILHPIENQSSDNYTKMNVKIFQLNMINSYLGNLPQFNKKAVCNFDQNRPDISLHGG